MYIGYFNRNASHSLDLLVCMVKCLIFFFGQQSSHCSENVKCFESLHGRDNIVDRHKRTHARAHAYIYIYILEDNFKIDIRKV